MKNLYVVSICVLTLLTFQWLWAEEPIDSPVLAELRGTKILATDVEKAAASRLDQLEIERLSFEAKQRQKRYQILESTLQGLISQKLLSLEAESRNLTEAQLLKNEVQDKLAPPTDEMVEQFYEKNKKRFRGSKEEVLPHVRKLVESNQLAEAKSEFLESLKTKHQFRSYFEPLRVEVETRGFPSLGPEDAPVTIVEFSDFECPYCSKFSETLKRLTEEYKDKVRLVFRNFPLNTIHPNAQKASEASLCAAEQGKFWELHDLMFSEQKKLAVPDLKAKAESLGLRLDEFQECLDTGKHADSVKEDLYEGVRTGVSGTPALFVNGRFLSGAVPYEAISKIVQEELHSHEE